MRDFGKPVEGQVKIAAEESQENTPRPWMSPGSLFVHILMSSLFVDVCVVTLFKLIAHSLIGVQTQNQRHMTGERFKLSLADWLAALDKHKH